VALYRLVTGIERVELLARIPATGVLGMPPYGELVKDDSTGRIYLYWRNAVGFLYVIDVTANPPEHFYQHMPVPEDFWTEVSKNVSTLVLHLQEFMIVAAIIAIALLIFKYAPRRL